MKTNSNSKLLSILTIAAVVLCSCCWLASKAKAQDAPATTPTEQPLPTIKVNPKDGAEMVLVPVGDFLMGSTENQLAKWLITNTLMKREWFSDELPQRKVEVDVFYIYKTEITVTQYRKFCEETGHDMPKEPYWKWQNNHPIVNVYWKDAKAYADWAGVMLPTEAQWEKAARGTDGRQYPWGDIWDDKKCSNSSGKNNPGKTSPVGSFPAGNSPYGVMDIAGNVWELCADWYSADYYNIAPSKNPTGPEAGGSHVIRGGSWINGDLNFLCAHRSKIEPNDTNSDVGFRCVVAAQKP